MPCAARLVSRRILSWLAVCFPHHLPWLDLNTSKNEKSPKAFLGVAAHSACCQSCYEPIGNKPWERGLGFAPSAVPRLQPGVPVLAGRFFVLIA